MIYVVGGGSIASGKVSSRINLTNAFSDSCAVYYALTMRLGVGQESQPDLLPLVCQRTTCRSRDPTLGTCIWVGPLSSHGICLSMRDCLLQLSVNRLSRCLGQQKGGHARSRRRAVIGLDHRLGPTPRKCGREGTPVCATRL